MQCYSNKNSKAFTLVEIMVVVVIMLIMISAIIGLGKIVHDNAREKLTKSTLQILVDALQEYKSSKGQMGRAFVFPNESGVGPYTLFADMLTILNSRPENLGGLINDYSAGNHNAAPWPYESYCMAANSIEIFYTVISDVAACRTLLNKLPNETVRNLDNDSLAVRSTTLNREMCEIYDAWGTPLRYQNQGVNNLPLIQSAGKDGQFDTEDDIFSTDI